MRHIDKWPEALKHAAMRAAIWKYSDNSMDLLDFLQNVAKLGALDNEMLIFLKVFRQVGPAAAMALKQCSTDRGRNMAEIVEGIDLDAITEKDVLSRVAGGSPQSAAPAQTTGELWQE